MLSYTCPICSDKLYKIKNKLVCGNEQCNFQCLEEDYKKESQPWNLQKCNDSTLWKDEGFDNYPYIISREYKRLYYLLEQGKLYGVIFQIKDIFEVMLKFPTLLVLSEFCNNKKRCKKENDTLQFLLSKMLSLGDWCGLAKKCSQLCKDHKIANILKDITKIYEKNNITKWRNDTLGHGALMFDDTQEFRDDLVKMLQLIKQHFDRCNNEYMTLRFTYKFKNKIVELVGNDLNGKGLESEGELFFKADGGICKINDLIKVYDKSIFFFDAYSQWDRKTKMLNYLDAKIIKFKLKYFEELYKYVAKNTIIEGNKTSKLNNEIYIESEESIIKFINKPDQIIQPNYLKKWISDKLEYNSKGIYLLQMEEGMGKTTFSRILDPHSYKKIKLSKVTIRAYYVNSTYSYKVGVFKNDIIELLKTNDDKTDRIKGNYIQFYNQLEVQPNVQFSNILNEFQKIYQEKFETEKMLLIIDGIDEVPDLSEESILNYIPAIEDLEDNVHILITSRVKSENPEYINLILDKINFTDKLEVLRKDENYIGLLGNYITNKLKISNKTLVEDIIKESDNRFIYIRPIEYVMQYNEICDIKSINIFKEFFKILSNNYTEKYYNEIIDLLIILAIAREGLSLKEISFLLNYKSPDFKILAYLADISCLLSTDRTYRGTIISLSHISLKKFIIQNYSKRIEEIVSRWFCDVIGMDYSNIRNEEKYIVFNILYLTKKYNSSQVQKLINSENMKLTYIYEIFATEQMKKYEIHLLIQFMDDLISVLETNIKSNAINLVIAYIYRMQAFMKYAFGGINLYYNYIDRALEIMEMYSIKDDSLKIQAYKLRSEYYRKTGNIKKSFDDNMVIGEYLASCSENELKKIGFTSMDNVFMLHSRSINLKNLGKINEALEDALKAELIVENDFTLEGRCLYSNVLNNLGLCYLKIEKLDLAEKNIRKSIKIIEEVNNKFGYKVDEVFYNYANLGQILRKKNKFNEAIEMYNKSIDEIRIQENKGYFVDGNQKALQFNGRANIYIDLALEKNDKELYEVVVRDYLTAINIMENLETKNQDIRFLVQLYLNMATLYQNNLKDHVNAAIYKNKCNELNRISLRNQLDLINKDDIMVDEKINYIQANQCFEKANELFGNNKFSRAIDFYKIVIELLEKLKFYNDERFVKEMIVTVYYNKACCAHALLSQKIMDDYNLSCKKGIKIVKNYDEFNPQSIINDFLICEPSSILNKDEKSQMYEHISHIYCEAIMDYEKAKDYALKAIEVKANSSQAYCCLANAYYELEDYKEAIKFYKIAQGLTPNDITIQNNIRYAYMKLEEVMFSKYFNI